MTYKTKITIISTKDSHELAKEIAAQMKLTYTEVYRDQFKDGEVLHVLPLEKIDGMDVVIVGSTHSDEAQQEILDLIAGCQYWNAHTVNVVIPYLGYSTMERAKAESGEIPKGVTRIRQLYNADPDFVALVDLHAEAVEHAHDGLVQTRHIQTYGLMADEIRKLGIEDIVLVSPDYGRSKWVSKIADILGVPHTAADKDRFDIDQTMVSQVAEVVKGKTAIIIDDMIRTGGSIVQTAERCIEAGAKDTIVMATHLILAGDAREKFANSPIKFVMGANTYPGTKEEKNIKVYSVAPLIADCLNKQLDIIN